jgi:hypothetical protein
MPGVFEKFGIKFLYPENWQVTEEGAADEWPKTVTVQSPGDAFLSIYVYEGGVNLRELVHEAVEAMRAEYQDLEEEEVLQPDDADYGYNLDFYCLDLVVTTQIRGALLPGLAVVWQCQAESREFEECAMVFRAITTTLRGKLPDVGQGSP